MSVLTRPQGLPERVWSLIAGLRALGGSTDRATCEALINPGFVKDGVSIKTKAELAGDTWGAASSLGLVNIDRSEAALTIDLPSQEDFSDHLHDYFASLPPGDTNAVLFEAYAWVVAESGRRGDLGWIYDIDRKAFSDLANVALVTEGEDGRPINETKVVPWRRWLAFMGMGVPLPLVNAPDFPTPASRMAREIQRASLPAGEEIAADRFLAVLAERMPYLDGGRLFLQACKRIEYAPRQRVLSPLLSAALWDLHDDGVIALRPRGDSADAMHLSGDSAHAVQTFNSVVVISREESQ